jgi:phosphoenolpyruvate carboxykinase (ATP)
LRIQQDIGCKYREYTGRSPQDRFIVRDSISEDKVWWGKVNIRLSLLLLKTLNKVTAYQIKKFMYVILRMF